MIDPTLPLIDLHRHLDGSMRLQTILDLAHQHHIKLPAGEVETLRPHVQVIEPQPGVMAFIGKFRWMTAVLVDYAACRRVAYENVLDLQTEGIAYAELRFSPWFMAETHGLDPAGVTAAVCEGVTDGCQASGVRVNLIGIISRTYGVEAGWRELNALLTQRDQLCALDLAGDEAHYPAQLFSEHFQRAQEVGWHITIHAGEFSGPESIWQALALGAERIGHGLRASEDHRLMDELARRGTGVESNLTSNVQTSVVNAYANHPLRRFLEHGIKATINTDDPGISGITLPHEYEVAAPAAGLTPAHARQAQQNALDVAFLTPDQRAALAPLATK